MERVLPVLFLSVGQSTYASDKLLRWLVKLKINLVQVCVPCVLLHSIPSVALLLNTRKNAPRM